MKDSNDPINIAFCIDSGAHIGLQVTLASLLHHSNPNRKLDIYVFHCGVSDGKLRSIKNTILKSGRTVSFHHKEIHTERLNDLHGFVGGQMTYARLFLPEFLPNLTRAVYLDADLLITTDVSSIFDFDLSGRSLAAASWQSRSGAHDRKLFISHRENIQRPYYNAGVLLFDLARWRERGLTKLLYTNGQEISSNLISHDQSLINLYLYDEITPLPRRYNTTVSPRRRPLSEDEFEDRIIHLVARPKPWDPLGFLNGQFKHYQKYLRLTDIENFDCESILSIDGIRKVSRSFRGYLKCLNRR